MELGQALSSLSASDWGPCSAAPSEGEGAGWDLRGPSGPGGGRGNGAQEREGDLLKVTHIICRARLEHRSSGWLYFPTV